MKLDKNSRGTLALVYSISAVAATLLLALVHNPLISWPACAVLVWFCLWQTFFFRIPDRKKVGSDCIVSSVADGKVVIVEKVFEPEFLNQECIQISVYMNFFDVHANFWPIDGEVEYYRYYPGAHMMAFYPKSSELNEHTCTGLKNASGQRIFFKQIAGGFARRIVNYAENGLSTVAGNQCGIIKFGSRIDMFLPLSANVKVAVGDFVRACETVLAEI